MTEPIIARTLTSGGGGGLVSSFQRADAMIDGKQEKQAGAQLTPPCTASWEIIYLT